MKNRIKQIRWILITLILLCFLSACTNRVNNDYISNKEPIGEVETAKKETEEIDEIVSSEKDTNDEKKKEDLPTDRNSMINAYISILEGVLINHTFPDGKDYGYDDYYDISENQFAVYDIDRDGKDELIIEYITTAMAGMVVKIYDFNSSINTAIEQFSEFPNLTYYNNGVIEAGWSHNQGLAGDFWPYTLYRYDQESDTYIEVGMVDAWDKSLSETDNEGKHFPDDIDKNGDGVVYFIMLNGKYEKDNLVDLEEYNQWRDSYVGGAEKVKVPFMKLNEENINSIK